MINKFSFFGKVMDKQLKRSLVLVLLSRFLIFYVAFSSSFFVIKNTSPNIWDANIIFFNLFARWDSAYYAHIATHGYTHDVYLGFFPFYPFILKIFHPLMLNVGINEIAVSGFLLSNIFFVLTCVYFFKLTHLLFLDKNLAYLSVVFISIFPASIFFSAMYSESLFMFLTIAAFYYMEKGEWQKSTVLGVLSGITKFVGFLVFIPLLWNAMRKPKKAIIYPILVSLSPLIFFAYSYFLTGDLFKYIHVQESNWNRGLFNPIYALQSLPKGNLLILIPILAITVISFIYYFFRIFKSNTKVKKILPYYYYAVVLLIVYLISGPIISFPRYVLTLMPIFWFMAEVSLRSSGLKEFLFLFNSMLLALGTVLFVNLYMFI
jgi:Gpi18-like mannosyltransferase